MRWIVDAMNVIGSRPDGWWRDRRRAMDDLVRRLERWATAEGHSVTVVFEHPTPIESSVLTVAHAPRAAADAADDEIVRLVRTADDPALITVVTSDAALAERVRSLGVAVHPAARFRALIDGRGDGGSAGRPRRSRDSPDTDYRGY
ncbi:NYN domain-containing protein [Mycolicibacterium thermoresistibile]